MKLRYFPNFFAVMQCSASPNVPLSVIKLFPDPPTIKESTTSTDQSWIGQTVTLKCVSDGVPTPTLTWYKPDGSQLNSVIAAQNTVNVKMNVDQDFGGYKCDADNGITPADFKIVKIQQISTRALSFLVLIGIARNHYWLEFCLVGVWWLQWSDFLS